MQLDQSYNQPSSHFPSGPTSATATAGVSASNTSCLGPIGQQGPSPSSAIPHLLPHLSQQFHQSQKYLQIFNAQLDSRMKSLAHRLGDAQEELRQILKLRDSPDQLQKLISTGLVSQDSRFNKGQLKTQIVIDAKQTFGSQVIQVNRIQKLFVGFQEYQPPKQKSEISRGYQDRFMKNLQGNQQPNNLHLAHMLHQNNINLIQENKNSQIPRTCGTINNQGPNCQWRHNSLNQNIITNQMHNNK